jgi:hypothetical protein
MFMPPSRRFVRQARALSSQAALLSDLLASEATEAASITSALGDPRLYARLKTRTGPKPQRVDWFWFATTKGDEHLAMLADLLLLSAISLYEQWNEEFSSLLPSAVRSLGSALEENPDHPANDDIEKWIASKRVAQSPILRQTIQTAMKDDRGYHGPETKSRVLWFRVWKELRNAIAHGGTVDNASRFARALQKASGSPLALKSAAMWNPDVWVSGASPQVTPFEVVGLLELLQSLVRSADVAVLGLACSEDILRTYWSNGEETSDHNRISAANTSVGHDNPRRRLTDRVNFIDHAFAIRLTKSCDVTVSELLEQPQHPINHLANLLPPRRSQR